MGYSIDYSRDLAKLKDQIFYEKNGRFANKTDAKSFNTTHDMSTLIHMTRKENHLVSLYQNFLETEKETYETRKLNSQSNASENKKEDEDGVSYKRK